MDTEQGDWARAMAISEAFVTSSWPSVKVLASWPTPDGKYACCVVRYERHLVGIRAAIQYHPFEMDMHPDDLVTRHFVEMEEDDACDPTFGHPVDGHGIHWRGTPVASRVDLLYPPAPTYDLESDPSPEVIAEWLLAWKYADSFRRQTLERFGY